jgi:hypothetical protein
MQTPQIKWELLPLDHRGGDSAVGIATGYELDGRSSSLGRDVMQTGSEAHPASSPSRNGGHFARSVKLTTHLQLVPSLMLNFLSILCTVDQETLLYVQ